MFGSNKDYVTAEQLNDLLAPLNQQIADLLDSQESQTRRIEALEEQLAQLSISTTSAPIDSVLSPSQDKPVPPVNSPVAASLSVQTFYLSAPSAEGVFSDASLNEHSGSIYQLTTADGLNGNFIMLSTPDAIAMAMISVSQFVKPACRIDGSTHRQARAIVTLEEGVAQRDGDVWRVMKKAVVRFD